MEAHPAPKHPPPLLASTMDNQGTFDNIDGRMHGSMSGFIRRYFGVFPYVHQDAEMQSAEKITGRCDVPSSLSSPDDFLGWFSVSVSRQTDGARGSWHISGGDVALKNGITDDGARLLLTISATLIPPSPMTWDYVQVIGQFYNSGCVSYREGLLQLCRSAHQVFAAQPTRLFLHGFYIRGSLIEFWVFDRSGLYCSEVFDMQRDLMQFGSIILNYSRMTDQDLGQSEIIQEDKGGSYITLEGMAEPSPGKLYLESHPIASREGIVGPRTTCYRARVPDSNRWDYIIKFKWRWARERPEDELLKLSKEKCV